MTHYAHYAHPSFASTLEEAIRIEDPPANDGEARGGIAKGGWMKR